MLAHFLALLSLSRKSASALLSSTFHRYITVVLYSTVHPVANVKRKGKTKQRKKRKERRETKEEKRKKRKNEEKERRERGKKSEKKEDEIFCDGSSSNRGSRHSEPDLLTSDSK